jgi:putative hemolysin
VRNANLDDTVGVVVLRELVLTEESSLVDAVRPAYLLPDSLRLVDALRRFKDDRQQMALVVDERGAVDGIVTLEDLLEELVGEIYAETDRDVVQVRREPDGSMLLPGTFPLHDLPDVGIDVELPDSTNYTTIAGLILARLGHVPDRPGEIVNLGRWAAEVSDVERRAISAVRLSPNRSGSGSDR